MENILETKEKEMLQKTNYLEISIVANLIPSSKIGINGVITVLFFGLPSDYPQGKPFTSIKRAIDVMTARGRDIIPKGG